MPTDIPVAPQPPLAATVKYNPHLWRADELRAIFVVRTRELTELLEHLKATPPDATPQHILITGARGMGKSTLLRRVALAVEDDAELSRQWVALTFPEEQYTVGSLAEFWRNVLDALADTLERQGAPAAELAQIDEQIRRIGTQPAAERETAALDCLERWIDIHRRGLLLLIDSTDLLFAGLSGVPPGKNAADTAPLWRLRKTLSHRSGIFWLGASYQALESRHQYQDAFMDFFQLMELRPLKPEEMRAALLALACTFGAGRGLSGEAAVVAMTSVLDERPERLRALRAMTGGNPRTTVMLYELFAAGGPDDIHSDLRRLLDTMTPLYKARMESLSEQACKLLAHVMEHWAPLSARELGEISGIATGTVSGQLSRLEAEGLVEKTALPGVKRVGYQAGERLFNIWYLMRYAPRRLRQRLTWLVEFMRQWYSGEELSQLARRRAARHRDGDLRDGAQLEFSRVVGLALAEDDDARHQLEHAVFNAARIADQTRRVPAELFELDGADREYTTAEEYLNRFHALDERLTACPWVDDATRDAWIAVVKGSVSLSLVEKERIAAAELNVAEYQRLLRLFETEREHWEADYGVEATQAVYAAVLCGDFFPDCPDAKLAYTQIMADFGEDASALCFALALFAQTHHGEWLEKVCRHAVKLNPRESYVWNNPGVQRENRPGRLEEVEAVYRCAAELDGVRAYSVANLARLLARSGKGAEAGAAYRRAAKWAQVQVSANSSGLGDVALLLQAHLYLDNRDLAQQALDRLARAAATGNQWAFFRLKIQIRECHAIGRGRALQALMAQSPWADFLQPFGLALAAAQGDVQALDGAPLEIRRLAEEVLQDLQATSDRSPTSE